MVLRNWTTAAHADFFERNIVTEHFAADSAAARAYNEFVSNAQTVTWPTIGELQTWVESPSYQGVVGGDGTDVALLQLVLDVAVSKIAGATGNYVRPVDADGAVDPAGSPVQILPEIKLAAIIQASIWYDARVVPESPILAEVVEALIGNERQFGLA